MKEILKKLLSAKKEVKETKIKKLGENKYSQYKYFTPEQIEQIVFAACDSNNLITLFELKRDTFGEVGILTIYDILSGESIKLEMATAIPEIKATNGAQQLGGCMTYTERYLKMSAFGIVENSLDLDNQKPEPSEATKPKKWLNEILSNGQQTKEYANVLAKISDGTLKSIEEIEAFYMLRIETRENLLKLFKNAK